MARRLHGVMAIARGRFIYLLVFMLLLMLLVPFLDQTRYGVVVMQVLYSFVLLSALYAASGTQRNFRIGVVLFVAGMLSHWWVIATLSPIPVVAGTLFEISFFSFVAVILLLHVFGHERVASDTIAGAICVFLLIGLIWSVVFQAIYYFDHRAFSNITGASFSRTGTVDFLYYSFTTLTTLGYGDISPLAKSARMFAVTEAVVGQVYLTVLVARLVALYAPVRRS